MRILQLIAMLGTFYAYSGLAVALTGGAATGRVPDCLIEWGRGQFATVPLPFLTTGLPAVVIAAVLLGGRSGVGGSTRRDATRHRRGYALSPSISRECLFM